MIKTLRVFIKAVIKKNRTLTTQLLGVLKVPKDKSEEMSLTQRIMLGYEKAPGIEEIRAVASEIEDIAAKVAFVLLAETGLRPIEILNLKLTQIDLDKRITRALHLSKTKRAYISIIYL